MSDYQEIDSKIIAAVRNGKTDFTKERLAWLVLSVCDATDSP